MMQSPVTITRNGRIGILTIDNPPVHALSTAVKQGLLDGLATLEADAACQGIVITTSGRTFVAGADISEMDRPPERPFTPELMAAFDAATKPTVAALFGNVLGGGFELALSCRLRVAEAGTRFGLPEVKLGLIPGAGGTQRMLRLTDFATAARLVTTGRIFDAEEALKLGLVTKVVEADCLTAAIAALSAAIETNTVPPSTSAGSPAQVTSDGLTALISEITKAAKGQSAPLRALEMMAATSKMDFTNGMARERALFLELRESAESKALRHLFMAERRAGRLPELENVTPRPVSRIGVIGAGLMGCGIGFAALAGGYHVTMIDNDAAAVERGQTRMAELMEASVRSGRLSGAARAKREAMLVFSADYASLAEADLVIEAVFEDLAVKRTVFDKLDAVVRPECILASNTSYLDLDTIAAATRNPARILGLHFFSPAHIMKLCEVVRGDKTAGDVLATGVQVARKLGKLPVVTGVCEGFCGNRILRHYRLVAEAMLEDGALPQEIDAAMQTYGFAMGPFAVQDMAGLEIAYANRKLNPPMVEGRRMGIVEALVEAGRLGRKNGKGWYLYPEGARQGANDPDVTALIHAVSAAKGRTRRSFTQEEITRRLIAAIQDEGSRILAEGIVARAEDIDLVLVHGYGYPSHKGGPMFAKSHF